MKHSSSDKLTPFSVFLVTAAFLLAYFNPSVHTIQYAVQRGFTSVGLPPFFKDRSYIHISNERVPSAFIPPEDTEEPWTTAADGDNWLPHMSRTIRQVYNKNGPHEPVWTNMFNIVKSNITSAISKVAGTPGKIVANAFQSTFAWFGKWHGEDSRPMFGPHPRPAEVLMHCAVGGNASYEASMPVPQTRSRLQRFWHGLPWSTYDRWSFRGFFNGGFPTRQSPYLYWPWYFMFYAYFFWPIYGFGVAVVHIPWLFVLKWGVFGAYLYGLHHVYTLCKQEQKQTLLDLEHKEWIEKILGESNGELIVDFLNKLPGPHDFQQGGKYTSKPYQYHSYNTYNIASILQRKLVENFLVYQARLKAAGKPHEWEIAYHGTRETNVQSILKHGLLVPGQMIPGTLKTVAHSTDIGYFGKGIYCSPNRSYSEGYGSTTLFVCLVLRGKHKKVEYKLGQPLATGFDSHVDPSANEFIFFDNRAVLPIYLMHQKGSLERLKITLPKWENGDKSDQSPQMEKCLEALSKNVPPPPPADIKPYVPPKPVAKAPKAKKTPSPGSWTKVVHFDGTVTWESPSAKYGSSSSSSSSPTVIKPSSPSTPSVVKTLPCYPHHDDNEGFTIVKSKKRTSKFSCVVH